MSKLISVIEQQIEKVRQASCLYMLALESGVTHGMLRMCNEERDILDENFIKIDKWCELMCAFDKARTERQNEIYQCETDEERFFGGM